jgi:hypothetical protein
MTRILLISGVALTREETLRRRVLRFTGSRRATRVILERIAAARQLGRVMSCMVVPDGPGNASEGSWDVRVSFTDDPAATGGQHA